MYFFSFTYNSIQLLGMWSKTFILIYKPLSHHTRTHTPITSHSNNSILHIPLSYHTHTPITSHSSTYPYHIIHTPITAHSNNSYTYPYHITLKYIHVPQSHHTKVHIPITSHSSTYPNHIQSHYTQVHTPIPAHSYQE